MGDLAIGRSGRNNKLPRYDGPAHLLTMATTRSGKGVGTIIPNLLLLDRSVICIDPKGENARVMARTRARKGDVWCLDPFGVSGCPASAHTTGKSLIASGRVPKTIRTVAVMTLPTAKFMQVPDQSSAAPS